MQTLVLKIDPVLPDSRAIEVAADAIQAGHVVAFPTETVYGLAADAFNLDAVARIYEVKGRPANNPLPVQVSAVEDVDRLVTAVPSAVREIMQTFWPGPLTIVFDADPSVSDLITAGTGKVGIRVPSHEVALRMIHVAGTSIVAPSANPSAQPPALDAEQVLGYFRDKIELLLDAGPAQIGVASTVIDVTTIPYKVIREGSISEDTLRPYL